MFAISLYYFAQLPYAWWWFAVFFLTPDLSMLGYLVNSKVGAISYNIFHHKGIAIAIVAIGIVLASSAVLFVGILLFAHASFDRILGYGLKYSDSFTHTHLGYIGKATKSQLSPEKV
jgi:ABC-type nitrate/sulfonate/bicarbonate transport system permease component